MDKLTKNDDALKNDAYEAPFGEITNESLDGDFEGGEPLGHDIEECEASVGDIDGIEPSSPATEENEAENSPTDTAEDSDSEKV